jgi:hypothetical protein
MHSSALHLDRRHLRPAEDLGNRSGRAFEPLG